MVPEQGGGGAEPETNAVGRAEAARALYEGEAEEDIHVVAYLCADVVVHVRALDLRGNAYSVGVNQWFV